MLKFNLGTCNNKSDIVEKVYPLQASLTINNYPTKSITPVTLGKLIIAPNGVVLVDNNGYKRHLYPGDTININMDLEI